MIFPKNDTQGDLGILHQEKKVEILGSANRRPRATEATTESAVLIAASLVIPFSGHLSLWKLLVVFDKLDIWFDK